MTVSLIGHNVATNEPVTIGQDSRRQGLYIIGATGQGKTGLIENLIIQDIKQGLGLCLLDPHGDLTKAILGRIPDNREKDVIYLDIADKEYPFGLNLFVCEDITDALKVQYTVDQIMHLFEKLFDVTTATPLLLQYLRNCTYLIVYNQGMTMAEVPLLLMDSAFRNRLLANVPLKSVQLFWRQYDQMRPADQIEQSAMILRRFDHFLQPLTEPIVGQSETTLSMGDIMDSRKILLVRLDMRMDAVTSMIGSTIVSLILNAAYARAALRQDKRKQFNLYADEFQNFATADFAILLTEARKYGVATTIAHQIRGQLDEKNKDASLNVGNIAVFKISGQDASDMAAEFDCTPPPPLLDRRDKVYSIAEDVVGHLLSLHGYDNPAISTFVETYILPLNHVLKKVGETETTERWDKSHARYVHETRTYPSQADRDAIHHFFYNVLNPFLFAVMKDKNAYKPIPGNLLMSSGNYYGFSGMDDKTFMEALGREKYLDESTVKKLEEAFVRSWEKIADAYHDTLPYVVAKVGMEFPYEQRQFFSTPRAENYGIFSAMERRVLNLLEEEKHLNSYARRGFVISFTHMYSSRSCTTVEELMRFMWRRWEGGKYEFSAEFRKCVEFFNDLRKFTQVIVADPIMVDSGKYEMKPGTQRTYADMQNEIASTLANLNKYTARVKVEGGEHTLKTLAPERGVSWKELQERTARIQGQTRKNHCRPRTEVEKEIAARQGPDDPGSKTKRTHAV